MGRAPLPSREGVNRREEDGAQDYRRGRPRVEEDASDEDTDTQRDALGALQPKD
jgi:hypothetical protein